MASSRALAPPVSSSVGAPDVAYEAAGYYAYPYYGYGYDYGFDFDPGLDYYE